MHWPAWYPAIWIAQGLVALLLGGMLALGLRRRLHALRLGLRRRRATKGERAAPALLESAGYRVLEDQAEQLVDMVVDGQQHSYRVRADFLVEREEDGARFVAEVKTGTSAPNPLNRSTRRQLLEYLVAYDVEGLLLVAPEEGLVQEVSWPALKRRASFDGAAPRESWAFVRGLAAGALLGAALAVLWVWAK